MTDEHFENTPDLLSHPLGNGPFPCSTEADGLMMTDLTQSGLIASVPIGAYRVSTVFLGANVDRTSTPPAWFETTVFSVERDNRGRFVAESPVDRCPYPTYGAALVGHEFACDEVHQCLAQSKPIRLYSAKASR